MCMWHLHKFFNHLHISGSQNLCAHWGDPSSPKSLFGVLRSSQIIESEKMMIQNECFFIVWLDRGQIDFIPCQSLERTDLPVYTVKRPRMGRLGQPLQVHNNDQHHSRPFKEKFSKRCQ